ncbi:dihydroxyacetone phosphate acyltransferase-like [Oncorhynchus masou masou]|uniref:dihydroxyacetone phosphate acyltransferase-like n=1 Tax=Oncorhynchus masou masou TaxID=90313 RepID=UPI0031842149
MTIPGRDDSEDILEERRNSSNLKYAFGCYSPVLYKGRTPCNANMLKNIVYSDQLRYLINQVSQESGEASDISQDESCVILEEMAYRLQISTVHFFAFTLSKDFKTLLQHVCINISFISTHSSILQLQQAIQEHPVVLLPSHCSYMDFPLMSYILYTYDLALPVIIGAGSMGAEGAAAPLEKSE